MVCGDLKGRETRESNGKCAVQDFVRHLVESSVLGTDVSFDVAARDPIENIGQVTVGNI